MANKVKEVAPGLWVCVREPREPETVQEEIKRRFQKREIFSKPLIPKRARNMDFSREDLYELEKRLKAKGEDISAEEIANILQEVDPDLKITDEPGLVSFLNRKSDGAVPKWAADMGKIDKLWAELPPEIQEQAITHAESRKSRKMKIKVIKTRRPSVLIKEISCDEGFKLDSSFKFWTSIEFSTDAPIEEIAKDHDEAHIICDYDNGIRETWSLLDARIMPLSDWDEGRSFNVYTATYSNCKFFQEKIESPQ